jgi:hypothetical protein
MHEPNVGLLATSPNRCRHRVIFSRIAGRGGRGGGFQHCDDHGGACVVSIKSSELPATVGVVLLPRSCLYPGHGRIRVSLGRLVARRPYGCAAVKEGRRNVPAAGALAC